MSEHELLIELHRIKSIIESELDKRREELWVTGRVFIKSIENLEKKIDDAVHQRLADTLKDFKGGE